MNIDRYKFKRIVPVFENRNGHDGSSSYLYTIFLVLMSPAFEQTND